MSSSMARSSILAVVIGVLLASSGLSFSSAQTPGDNALYLPLCLKSWSQTGFSYTFDESIVPSQTDLPGLSGGPPRPVGVIVGPDGTRDEFVVNEVVFHPTSRDDLAAFLAKYGGTVLRDGKPRMLEGAERPSDLPESTGWYLIRVDLRRSSLEDLSANMQAAGLSGQAAFSSQEGARLAALVARESGREVTANFIGQLDQCRVCEHPDYPDPVTGVPRNLDATTWWWMTEDDDSATPGDQGLSTGVIHAWDYVKYKGVSPCECLLYACHSGHHRHRI